MRPCSTPAHAATARPEWSRDPRGPTPPPAPARGQMISKSLSGRRRTSAQQCQLVSINRVCGNPGLTDTFQRGHGEPTRLRAPLSPQKEVSKPSECAYSVTLSYPINALRWSDLVVFLPMTGTQQARISRFLNSQSRSTRPRPPPVAASGGFAPPYRGC